LVSNTDFDTIALALENDAVKTAHAGDFVKIAGDFYHVIKTNPTVADDLSPAVAFLTASLANARATVAKSVADTITGI
jgi:hypothetical protein